MIDRIFEEPFSKNGVKSWLEDLEYTKYELPHPDATIFLDMPTETAQKLMAERANKIDNSDKKDIHERNGEYLKKSYLNAKGIAEKLSWDVISCADNDGNVRAISDIASDIWKIAEDVIAKSRFVAD